MKLPKKADAMVGQDKSIDDSEEGFLNPEDLSIIDEKTWEPSDEEILSYALKLGYDIEKDPDELFEVAYYYMKYPLPEGWKRAIYKKTKELMYINMEDGEIEVVTEIEEMAHQMYLEKKEEMIGKQLGVLDKDEKKDKNNAINSTKIPPLNPLKKSNSPPHSSSPLPPLKEKSGSKNNLFNDIENELSDKKNEKVEKNDFGMAIFVKDKEEDNKKNNNDDIFGISQKPIINSDNTEKENNKEKEKDNEDGNEKEDEKDKTKEKNKENNLDIYGIHAEESEDENEKEYGDEFDYDGIDDDDSDINKGEPLIKSMINKENEKEEKEVKEREEKLKKEKEEKEKKEKEEKVKKEKEDKLKKDQI